MARDSYIIRPKRPPRPDPKPVSREDRIAAIARVILDDVARNLAHRQAIVPRKPYGGHKP